MPSKASVDSQEQQVSFPVAGMADPIRLFEKNLRNVAYIVCRDTMLV